MGDSHFELALQEKGAEDTMAAASGLSKACFPVAMFQIETSCPVVDQ